MKHLPSRQFTPEDVAVFSKLFVTVFPRTPGAAIKWLRATAESDRRDAALMLDAQTFPLEWLCEDGAGGCFMVRWPWWLLKAAGIDAWT